jgi:hypothetical protein
MPTRITKTTTLIVVLLFLGLSGCATSTQMKMSGFLQDYSKLQPGGEDRADYIYINKEADFSKYKKSMVDKVVFYLTPELQERGIQPDVMKELADAFEKELAIEINSSIPMTDQAGPDTLRIRIAVTDVEPSDPVLNTVGAILPVGWVVSAASKATTGAAANVGKASIEMEVLDSVTGQILAAAIDTKVGAKYDVAGTKKWGHTKKAFKEWAQKIRERLDEVQGRTS